MDIHESHVMITTPINTEECANCWACKCHTSLDVFAAECKKTFAID